MEYYGTLGPSCGDAEILGRMLRNGITGMRLNLSHTTLRESAGLCGLLREAQAAEGIDCTLMIDMQGPEMRIGKLPEPLILQAGEKVYLDTDKTAPAKAGSQVHAPGQAPAIPVIRIPEAVMNRVGEGTILLMDDGKIRLQVPGRGTDGSGNADETSHTGGTGCADRSGDAGGNSLVPAVVLTGGRLTGRKSVAIEGVPVTGELLTAEDLQNLSDAPAFGVESVMQPFVHTGEDLRRLRSVMESKGMQGRRIFAKIEDLEGVRNLEDIIPEADCVVIARGDLGNAVPLWELPAVQKEISAKCRAAGRPFLVVTQMLAGMERSPLPTRAEVSDIYNAVIDGASALMLTGETAKGQYPAEAAFYLVKTAETASERIGRYAF